ncbi:MAG: cell division protein ZapA [Rickettsiaceae bacterium]
MSIVTITINNKDFKLSCAEESKSRVMQLAEKLDMEIREMADANKNASFELLLLITALGLMDYKESEIKLTGGEAIEKANQDFQKQLSSIFSKLTVVADKVKNC